MHQSDAKPAWEHRGLARKATILSFPPQKLVFIIDFSPQFPQTLTYKSPHSLTNWWDRLCCILEVWQVHGPGSRRVQKVSALPAEEWKPEFVSSLLGGAIMEYLTTLALNLSHCENKGQKVTFPKDFPWGHSLGINWVIQKVALTLLLVDLGLGRDPHLLMQSGISYPTSAVRKHRD